MAKKNTPKVSESRATEKPLPVYCLDEIEWDAYEGRVTITMFHSKSWKKATLVFGPSNDDLDQFENMAADLRPIIEALEYGDEEDVARVRADLDEQQRAFEKALKKLRRRGKRTEKVMAKAKNVG